MARLLSAFVIALCLLTCAGLPVQVSTALAAGKPLLIICGASVPIKDVSTSVLRRVFQGLPVEFAPGKRFIPINLPTSTPARVQFDRAVLGLEPNQVGAFWIDRRIRDESPPPRTVPSAELALRVAASLPGVITYVLPEMLSSVVKPLSIDGKNAGDSGYLLR